MPIYNSLPDHITEVDVVIAGGGAAGCIVAGRLAAASPSLSILVIEYGKDNYDVPSIIYPALFVQNILPDSETVIFYEAEVSPQLNGRKPVVQTGGTLGGGSSVNLMIYARAQRDDFDSWKTEGWGADEMIPYLQKLETYHGEGDPKVHGYDGPVHVSNRYFNCSTSKEDLLNAAGKLGYPTIEDLQNLDANNGFGTWYRTVSLDGKRQDSAHAYLHPLLRDGRHPNLHVLTESKATRVLFDHSKTATAVEFVTSPLAAHRTSDTATRTVHAKKQIVLSCGAIGTPLVLERSGIGKAETLTVANIEKIVADVPGVGHDYQDHNLIIYPYKVLLDPGSTLVELWKNKEGLGEAIAASLPLLGWNGLDAASKIRPTEDEVASLGPEFQSAWNKDYQNRPNRPLMLVALVSSYLGDFSTLPEGDFVSMATYTAYPYSRGSIHINSASHNTPPQLNTGFFTDAHDLDLKMHMWAYKKEREIMRRTKMYRGELATGHPSFPTGSSAACVDLALNETYDADNVVDLQYSEEDDKAIEHFLREQVQSTWHSLGTCKMAPLAEGGVVSGNLDVYGVKGLKVVDLSVVPENVGANTCNTAMAVGEKGADIILRELGL